MEKFVTEAMDNITGIKNNLTLSNKDKAVFL